MNRSASNTLLIENKKKNIVWDTKRPNTKYDRTNLIFEHYSLRLSHHMAFGYGFRHHDNVTNHILDL